MEEADAAVPLPAAEDVEPRVLLQGRLTSLPTLQKTLHSCVFRGIVRLNIAFARSYW